MKQVLFTAIILTVHSDSFNDLLQIHLKCKWWKTNHQSLFWAKMYLKRLPEKNLSDVPVWYKKDVQLVLAIMILSWLHVCFLCCFVWVSCWALCFNKCILLLSFMYFKGPSRDKQTSQAYINAVVCGMYSHCILLLSL